MNALKKLYLYINRHMKSVAIAWALCLVPVAIWPVLGWVVGGCIAALCILTFIGDYPCNWIEEVEVKGCGVS